MVLVSLNGLVTVRKGYGESADDDRTLSIDNRDQCWISDYQSEALIAQGAMSNLDEAEVLNIGLGCILDTQDWPSTIESLTG